MAKVLLVTGHSYQDYSVANKEIVKQLTEAIPGVEVDNLAELYPENKLNILIIAMNDKVEIYKIQSLKNLVNIVNSEKILESKTLFFS